MRVADKRPLLAVAAAAVLALGACVGDGGELATLQTPANGGALFQRYIALGNSITAGYQSGGIVDSLQRNSYANLLAQRASAPFDQPLIQGAGCPAPFTAPLTPAPQNPTASCVRVDAGGPTSNVAVPGVRIADLFITPSNPADAFQRFYGLLTGGKSEVQAMLDYHPSFVSVWIGNNDALTAATGGILGPLTAGADSNLTRLSAFSASADQLGAAMKNSGTQGAVMIGVVFADSASPLLQPGAFFFLARDAAGNFNGKPVNANCSPVNALGQPNPLAANLVSFAILSSAVPQIDCSGTLAGGAYVLDATERAVLDQRIKDYNAKLKSIADANGWLYVNPMDILRPELARTTSGRFNQVRKCQLLATATTAAQFQTAVLNSCPVTGATAAPNFFGALISYDGVHPSNAAHLLVARALATAINAKYGTSINAS
jgi:GDSL-like lipase/acylhydrolase family protein